MAENPFVYGEVVPAAAFVDRDVELDRLVADLAAGQKVFLISPRRYGKSSLIRQALAALARAAASLTVEVTVSSFSSYVAFLEGYARALVAARDARGSARAAGCASCSPRVTPEIRVDADAGGAALTVAFPAVRTERDVSRLAEEVFALPARLADAREPPARRRARRVPGDRRLQRRQRRARAARRRAAAAAGRLRLRRLGAEPDGADDRPEAAVLQGRAGDAPRARSRPTCSPRSSRRGSRESGITPEPGLGAAIVDLAGNLPYDVQRLAHETWDDVRARAAASARRSTICTRRCTGCSPSRRRCSRRSGSG